MLKKILPVILLMLCIQMASAAENLYKKHYKEQNDRGLKSLQAVPDTKIYVSNHDDEDNISMLEQGYDMMGSTGFLAGSITPDMALQHAREIKADVVLVYSKYASKQSSLSKLKMLKEAAKTTGEIDSELLEEDEQYQYYASYWAKLPMPLLGLHVIKLTLRNDSGQLEAEDGLKVLAVIKGSPAARAHIHRGDVLIKIGDIDLQKPEALSMAAHKYQGQTVNVAYTRDGQSATTKASINKR